MAKPRVILKKRSVVRTSAMSVQDLQKLDAGKVAYIKPLTSDKAKEMFSVPELPSGIDVYALHAADGTPLAVTDSRRAAVGHATKQNLVIHHVH